MHFDRSKQSPEGFQQKLAVALFDRLELPDWKTEIETRWNQARRSIETMVIATKDDSEYQLKINIPQIIYADSGAAVERQVMERIERAAKDLEEEISK